MRYIRLISTKMYHRPRLGRAGTSSFMRFPRFIGGLFNHQTAHLPFRGQALRGEATASCNARRLLMVERLLAHRIDPFRGHVRPSLEVIFRHGGSPGGEQGWVGGCQDQRSVLMREAGDFPQQLPVACHYDLGHASDAKGIERFDMERASRSGHFGLFSLATTRSTRSSVSSYTELCRQMSMSADWRSGCPDTIPGELPIKQIVA